METLTLLEIDSSGTTSAAMCRCRSELTSAASPILKNGQRFLSMTDASVPVSIIAQYGPCPSIWTCTIRPC